MCEPVVVTVGSTVVVTVGGPVVGGAVVSDGVPGGVGKKHL